LNALESRVTPPQSTKETPADGRRSKSPNTPRTPRKPALAKLDRPLSASPKPKKTTLVVPPPPPAVPSRKKTPSPRRSAPPKEESEEEDSYFEEDEEEEDNDEELRHLHDSREHEEAESDHDYQEDENDAGAGVVNSQVQALRETKFTPGTLFTAIADLPGAQTGDLSVRTGDILTLVEQRPDDWWLFNNDATKAQGVVPINYIQHLTQQRLQRRIKPSTSASTLVDAFKTNSNIPLGFVPSDLAPLAELDEYKIYRTLIPKMTESNLAYADLNWNPTKDQIALHDVFCQKILTIKECLKIPRPKGEQVDYCIDDCLRLKLQNLCYRFVFLIVVFVFVFTMDSKSFQIFTQFERLLQRTLVPMKQQKIGILPTIISKQKSMINRNFSFVRTSKIPIKNFVFSSNYLFGVNRPLHKKNVK